MLGQVLIVFFYVGPPKEDIFFDPIYDLIYFGVNSIILFKLRYYSIYRQSPIFFNHD